MGPLLGVGRLSVLGKSCVFSLTSTHSLVTLRGPSFRVQARQVSGAWASADGRRLPSGHSGGERPALRRSVRGKPVHPRSPAPELSEGKALLCLEGESNSIFTP